MPIEIKELIIRATIDPKEEDQKSQAKLGSGSQDEIIAECVEQVMGILEKQRER